ncbi:MAG: NAD(P) transhydrogenase subunit alpha [Phycisphaerales bacterium]|nr:NAD(P) transhydrogenase subunit alpha [Phycisphaerales bacterium]
MADQESVAETQGGVPKHGMPVIAAIVPKDSTDRRVPVTPESARAFVLAGWTVRVPRGSGLGCGHADDEYEAVGALLCDEAELLAGADVALCVNMPSDSFVDSIPPGVIVAGFLDPFARPDRIAKLADRGVTSLALELVPRTTIAQSMDGLSSQASLAGYAAVVLAASRLTKALPMMSTPAGTIKPARVLVVGTGVAGLQAIATAVRLGARVMAYDVRPTAKEQVESLGAKFAKIDLGETGETSGGYAKELTEAQLDMQREQLTKLCAESDVIVTTAQIFGRPAPVIVTADMVRAMKPGSVVVDAAISTGGNVEVAKPGEEIEFAGVTVIGDPLLPSRVARDASQVLASNFVSLLMRVIDSDTKQLRDPANDEILSGVLLTHGGVVRDERVVKLIESPSVGGAR